MYGVWCGPEKIGPAIEWLMMSTVAEVPATPIVLRPTGRPRTSTSAEPARTARTVTAAGAPLIVNGVVCRVTRTSVSPPVTMSGRDDSTRIVDGAGPTERVAANDGTAVPARATVAAARAAATRF